MSNIYTHKHHIIPRHLGGTDEPSNLIELTIEEHAQAHKKLYDLYNRWQDKVAWLAISGRIGKEEIIRMRAVLANTGKKLTEEHKRKIGEIRKGRKHTEETKRKMSEAHKGQIPWNKGIPLSEEIKRNMSKAQKGKNHNFFGKKHTEEARRKMSEAKKGNTHFLGKTHTEETKRKISETMRQNREKLFSKDA